MFRDFHKGDLDIKRLNYGVITLVPKVQEANTIKQYRPICLLNVDYKGFTKVLIERLSPIAISQGGDWGKSNWFHQGKEYFRRGGDIT
jgi:hypothetical protein